MSRAASTCSSTFLPCTHKTAKVSHPNSHLVAWVEPTHVLLSVGNGGLDELGVFGLLGGGEDQRGVGRGILGLVLSNGYGEASVKLTVSGSR